MLNSLFMFFHSTLDAYEDGNIRVRRIKTKLDNYQKLTTTDRLKRLKQNKKKLLFN